MKVLKLKQSKTLGSNCETFYKSRTKEKLRVNLRYYLWDNPK